MSANSVAIELGPDRLDVVVLRGSKAVRGHRESIALDDDPERWIKQLPGVAAKLKLAVAALDADGAEAILLYRSPTSTSDLGTFAFSSPAQVRDAAILGVCASLPYSIDEAVAQAAVIGRARQNDANGHHAVVTADRDDVCCALAETVESAGLRFATATPADAPLLAALGKRVLKSPDGPKAWLYVGESRAYLLVGGDGSLDFAREVGLGVASLREALTKPILSGHGGEQIRLSAQQARAIVYRYGIPAADEVVAEDVGLTGSEVRPLIQPTLQRGFIEVKQSLRIGFHGAKWSDSSLILTGPGSTLRGLAEVLQGEIGISVDVDEDYASFDHEVPGGAGSELQDVLSQRSLFPRINLRPLAVQASLRTQRLQRFLWAGAVLGCVLVAADFLHYHGKLRGARERLAVLETDYQTRTATAQAGESLVQAAGSMHALERQIDGYIGHPIAVEPILKELSLRTPETVSLTRLSLVRRDEGPIVMMTGIVTGDEDDSTTRRLTDYVDALESSPLFGRVALTNVQRGMLDDTAGDRFDASIEPIRTPRDLVERVISASAGEAGDE